MGRYRDLLAVPGVLRLLAPVTLTRTAVAMLSLAVLVAATQAHGYAAAGLVMLGYAFTNALAGPVRGRLADRRPPRRVLLVLLASHVVAYALLCLALATNAPMTVLLPASVLLGLTVPPSGPVVRGMWQKVVSADRLPTVYAFDAALNTATFVAGPVLATVLLLALPATAAVAVTALVKLVGDALVVLAPVVRGAPAADPHPTTRGLSRLVGPLVNGRVRLLLVLMALDTFTFGCLEVAAVAAASGQGTAGILTSIFGIGAAVSAFAYGARAWPGDTARQVLVLTVAEAVVLAAGAGLTGMVLTGLVFTAYGLVNGPVETAKQVLIGDASPANQRIEVFSWAFSVLWLGYGLGTTVAGLLADAGEPTPPLLAAAAGQLVAAAGTVGLVRTRAHA